MNNVYLQTLTEVSTVLHRYRFHIFILVAFFIVPFSSFAIEGDPSTDCPKKKKNKEDSIGIYESENKGLEEVQIQEYQKKEPDAKQTREKVNNTTLTYAADEQDQVSEEDPNSAMSFNFIYYIIDKFKFTDPLE
jgi:hypothetical protein